MALSTKEFELELRKTCDAFFERSGLPDAPFGQLLRGEAKLADIKAYYRDLNPWRNSLVFNQFTLPVLLEKCPDDEGRTLLWDVVYPEYGAGKGMGMAHTHLMRQFYLAIGFTPEEVPYTLDVNDPAVKKSADNAMASSFISLLTRNFLGPETVAPKVMMTFADALRKQFGMAAADVEFFRYHGEEDKNDSAVLFRLVARYATTDALQAEAIAAITQYYDQPRIRAYCAIRPVTFSFAAAM